jgi:hypothetical protein
MFVIYGTIDDDSDDDYDRQIAKRKNHPLPEEKTKLTIQILEDLMLTTTSEPEIDEVTGEWRKRHKQ